MKITVITGSPRKQGTTSVLADEFIKGVKEAGHDVFRFDAAFEKVAPCAACDRCEFGKSKCVQNDSMDKLNPELIAADYVVFITPLYYFGMSAQLKLVIDRFYSINGKLLGSGKKAILMAAAHDDQDWTMQGLVEHYKGVIRYLEWKNAGILLATGCGNRSDIEKTDSPKQAYEMGKNL